MQYRDFTPLVFPSELHTFVIAGPCSAESEEQVMTTARSLRDEAGVRIFRAGLWKPRTLPGCFEGVGEAGLPWLMRVQDELGMQVATEVATREHVELALKAGIKMLWLGARTTSNPFAVQEIADTIGKNDAVTVLIKNPISPDLDLWTGALERLRQSGVERIGAVHRGFSTYAAKTFRNPPHWQIPFDLKRRFPSLTVLCDPSHISGRREWIETLCRQAMEMNFDGLIVESHCRPDEALSDAAQQITPQTLATILHRLSVPRRQLGEQDEELLSWRMQIDQIDEGILEMLARRMQVADQIGRFKKEHNIAVVQSMRYEQLQRHRAVTAQLLGLDEAFVSELFSRIHEESVRLQTFDNSSPQTDEPTP